MFTLPCPSTLRHALLRFAAVSVLLIAAACGGGGGSDSGNNNSDDGDSNGGGGNSGGGATPAGLDARPSTVTCTAGDSPAVSAAAAAVVYGTENISAGAPTFSSITKIIQAPAPDSRWFVLEQDGTVWTFAANNPAAATVWWQFSVLSNAENGLLSLAFHPDYPTTPEVFVYYIDSAGSHLARMRLDNTVDPVSPAIDDLLLVPQTNSLHNGGDLDFDSNGYLYWSLGDDLDPSQAQDPANLYGSVIRIIPPTGSSTDYGIPGGNPFSGNARCGGSGGTGAACPEIFAWGFRNPFRLSIDSSNLWVADVGQSTREEVDQISITATASDNNYGWPCKEGFADFDPGSPACQVAILPLQDPLLDYPRSDGQSVTGGYVYRGTGISELIGRYVFADFVTGNIWATQGTGKEFLLDSGVLVSSLARGNDGEIYIADRSNGRILLLTGSGGGGGGGNDVPDNLADTNCRSTDTSGGLIEYTVNAPFWSDGATKQRYFAIPAASNVGVSGDNLVFPPGTVIVKDFRLNGQLIETRLLMRHTDAGSEWAGYTYEWNDAQTQATRVRDPGGKTRMVQGQEWIYPGEGQCLDCHTPAAGYVLGPDEIAQLNGDLTYGATGRTANQLETLDAINVLTLTQQVDDLPALADPSDTGESLADRARAVLDTNCANCHRPDNQASQSSMDLRYTTPLADMNVCNAEPLQGDLGIADAKLLEPGFASRSLIVARMNRRDNEQMPPLGSTVIDSASVVIVRDWINSLADTDCF